MNKSAYNPITGVGARASFEKTFAQMAETYINENCPALSRYGLGFQLLRMEDDGMRAEGVLAYKLGNQLIYIPVFFKDGRLKGAEMMLVDGLNLLLPANDDWVGEILNQKPLDIGEGIKPDVYRRSIKGIDFRSMSNSPFKYGAAREDWNGLMTDYAVKYAKIREGVDGPGGWDLNLPNLCDKSAAFRDMLRRHMDAFPMLRKAVNHYYPEWNIHEVKVAAGMASDVLDGLVPTGTQYLFNFDAKPIRNTEFDVYFESDKLVLNDDSAIQIKTRGYAVKDTRNKIPVVVHTDDATQRLVNPTENGIYDIFFLPSKIERCAVLINPQSPKGNVGYALVIVIEGENAGRYVEASTTKIWSFGGPIDFTWGRWVDSLGSPPPSSYGCGVFIHHRSATVPITLTDYDEDDGRRTYCGYMAKPTAFERQNQNEHLETKGVSYGRFESGDNEARPTVIWEEWRKGISRISDVLYVGGDCKWYPVSRECGSERLMLGTPREWETGLLANANRIKVASVAGGFRVESQYQDRGGTIRARSAILDRKLGVPQLMLATHMGEKEAEAIIKAATPWPKTYWIAKTAYGPVGDAGYLVSFDEPDDTLAGNMLTRDHPANMAKTEIYNIDGPDPSGSEARDMYDLKNEPPGRLADAVQQAAATGQQELFDVSVLKSLIESSDQRGLFDAFVGTIIRGGDAIGRVLIQMWSHPDEADERFGKADRANIEDMLRSAFEAVGKVAINLKRRTIRPGGVELAMSSD